MNLSTTVQNMQARALQADNDRLRYELTQVRAENMSLREQQDVLDAAMWDATERSLYRSLLREAAKQLWAEDRDDLAERIEQVLGATNDDS